MTLERILKKYPDSDCRRIDLAIGEKDWWGKGIGTETIRVLTRFGFMTEHVEMLFGCDIADSNERSLGAFREAGFHIDAELPGDKTSRKYDLALSKEEYLRITKRSR
jgi:RimJ/RimL family protein N-acetyltransferase